MPTPLDSFLNPDGTLNLAAIYSRPEGTAADAALAAQGQGQYRDYGNVTGPAFYTDPNDPGSTPAYWGGSPYGVGGQQAYDPAAHGGATNPYAASLLAQLAGGAQGPGMQGGGFGPPQATTGAPAGYVDPGVGGGGGPGFQPMPLGPEYYDSSQPPPIDPGAGNAWSWGDGRWILGPQTAATASAAAQAPAAVAPTWAEQGPGEAGIYPGGSGPVAATTRGGNPIDPGTRVTPAVNVTSPMLGGRPFGSGPGPAPVVAPLIKRLTQPRLSAAPVAASSSNSGLINWR